MGMVRTITWYGDISGRESHTIGRQVFYRVAEVTLGVDLDYRPSGDTNNYNYKDIDCGWKSYAADDIVYAEDARYGAVAVYKDGGIYLRKSDDWFVTEFTFRERDPIITYVTEHGVAPEEQTRELLQASVWYWPDDEFYTPNPQMISVGLNDGDQFNIYGEDFDRSPAVLVRNYATEELFWLVFDNGDVMSGGIKIWDNGDDTYKFYTRDNIKFCYAGYLIDDLWFETPPTFEEIVTTTKPAMHTVESDGETRYIGGIDKKVFTTKNSTDNCVDWQIVWISDWFHQYCPTIYPYNHPYEQMEPCCYLLTGEYGDTPILEAEGYTFKGWYLDGELVECNTPIISDVTLVAQWEADTPVIPTVDYTIRYQTAFGTAPANKTVTVNEGESYTLTSADLPVLTADGYTFVGWELDGNLVSVGDTISADAMLVASWVKDTADYTISYSTAHGTAPESKTVTVNIGESYALTADDLPSLTAPGYVFGGWTIGGVLANVGDTISANTVLTAVWVEDTAPSDAESFWLGYRLGCMARQRK